MYLFQVLQKGRGLNGITRIVLKSGDVLEGKVIGMDDTVEFALTKGGTAYFGMDRIESITLLDNLQLLEEKVSEHPNL